jgi:hypothetical protein
MRTNFKWRDHEVLVVTDGGEPVELHIQDCIDDVLWLLDDEGYDDLRQATRLAIRREQNEATPWRYVA